MQETQVQSLVREDPTCWEATKPMCHNYWASALEAQESQLAWSPCTLESLCYTIKKAIAMRSLCTVAREQPPLAAMREKPTQQWRPTQPNKYFYLKKIKKNSRVGCHFLLQGVFPTQGSNSYLLHCKQILFAAEPVGKQR